MDHLWLPSDDWRNTPFRVPFLCTKQFDFDDGPFPTYLERAGVDLTDLLETNMDSLALFLQEWLWFGLLRHSLDIDQKRKPAWYESFMTRDKGQLLLCTSELYESIEKAGKKIRTPVQADLYTKNFNICIRSAKDTINGILASKSCTFELQRARRFTDLRPFYVIILSIQVLIETLDHSRHILFPRTENASFFSRTSPHDLQVIDRRLRDAHWPVDELTRIPESVRLRYVLSFMAPPKHEAYLANLQVSSILDCNRPIVEPRHTTDECCCPHEGLCESSIGRIISREDIPILTFTEAHGGGKRQLKIHEPPYPNFVAFSHVRIKGLGNSHRNALPTCQLIRLQELANSISTGAGPSAFWIDTMCVPPRTPKHTEAHEKGVRRMEEAFVLAEKVLVLDPSLYTRRIGSYEEALIRIRFSDWKTRLWTLQEGAVAKKLFIQFRDRFITLDELLAEYESSSNRFRLLQARHIEDSAINRQLFSILGLMQHEIRFLRGKPEGSVGGLVYKKLYTILRLGFLALPIYRYFVDNHEAVAITKVLPALADAYLDGHGNPLTVQQCEGPGRISVLGQLQALHEDVTRL